MPPSLLLLLDVCKPLHVIASGVVSKKAVVLTSKGGHFKTLRELTECMRASMLLPGITGPMVSGLQIGLPSPFDVVYLHVWATAVLHFVAASCSRVVEMCGSSSAAVLLVLAAGWPLNSGCLAKPWAKP